MQEITIKLPDIVYKSILDNNKIYGDWKNDLLGILCNAIAHGTPLPKGHGRLIDADALKLSEERHTEMGEYNLNVEHTYYTYYYSVKEIKNAQVIIEADTESETT